MLQREIPRVLVLGGILPDEVLYYVLFLLDTIEPHSSYESPCISGARKLCSLLFYLHYSCASATTDDKCIEW